MDVSSPARIAMSAEFAVLMKVMLLPATWLVG